MARFISVIIATYGREQILIDSINDVLKQDYPAFEVIVVDQTEHHEPDTDRVLNQMAECGKIKYFKLDWASLPGARNYGVRRAKGEIGRAHV